MPHIGGLHNALHRLRLTFSPDDNPQVFSSLLSGGKQKRALPKSLSTAPFRTAL